MKTDLRKTHILIEATKRFNQEQYMKREEQRHLKELRYCLREGNGSRKNIMKVIREAELTNSKEVMEIIQQVFAFHAQTSQEKLTDQLIKVLESIVKNVPDIQHVRILTNFANDFYNYVKKHQESSCGKNLTS